MSTISRTELINLALSDPNFRLLLDEIKATERFNPECVSLIDDHRSDQEKSVSQFILTVRFDGDQISEWNKSVPQDGKVHAPIWISPYYKDAIAQSTNLVYVKEKRLHLSTCSSGRELYYRAADKNFNEVAKEGVYKLPKSEDPDYQLQTIVRLTELI